MGDPENEKKLKKQIRKYKALFEDTQEQLENEREKRSNSSIVKSLKNQLEELQVSEATALKNYKWLQGDMDELQGRYDDLVRDKSEVRKKGVTVEGLVQ
jgi:myosin-18